MQPCTSGTTARSPLHRKQGSYFGHDPKFASTLTGLAFLLGLSAHAAAMQVPLTGANVIGGSGAYNGATPWDVGQFNARLILDKQTGAIIEDDQNGGDADGGFWINPDNGPANAYIVIDLGEAKQIDFLELYNTHNAGFNDRGTGQFRIVAGNAVTLVNATVDFDLTGATSVIVNGALLPQSIAGDPLDPQIFDVTDTNTYRYLRFEPLTVGAFGTPCCGANVYGLNELRVFQTPVPEPASAMLVGFVATALMAAGGRRRRA